MRIFHTLVGALVTVISPWPAMALQQEMLHTSGIGGVAFGNALSDLMAAGSLAAVRANPGLDTSAAETFGALTIEPANGEPGRIIFSPFALYYKGSGLTGSQASGIGGILVGGPSATVYPTFEQVWFKNSSFKTGSKKFDVSDSVGLHVGQEVVDESVPIGSKIVAIEDKKITLSDPATKTVSVIAQFGRQRWDPYSNIGANIVAGKRGYFGAAAQYSTTELGGGVDLPDGASLYSVSPSGGNALVTVTRSSADTGSVYGRTIADTSFCFNDNSKQNNKTTWCRYTQALHSNGVNGLSTFAEESSIANREDSAILDPYQVNVPNSVFNFRVDCGVGRNKDTGRCSAPFQVINNGSSYHSGIIINSGSMSQRMVNSTADAIALPQNYAIDWFAGPNKPTWHIYASAGSDGGILQFGTQYMYVKGNPQGSDSNTYFRVQNSGNGEARIGPSSGSMIALNGSLSDTPTITPVNAENVPTHLSIGGANGAGLQISSPLQRTVSGAVAASGSTQSTATEVRSDLVVVISGTGGIRILTNKGGSQSIYNRSGSTINIYPNTGSQIEKFGIDNPVSLVDAGHIVIECINESQCFQGP